MPKIQNNFLKSKMNKDLDERLVPNGEYRDAINITISHSEGSDVGTIQTLKGTAEAASLYSGLLADFNFYCLNLLEDEAENRVFIFTTNNTDNQSDPSVSSIFLFDITSNTLTELIHSGAYENPGAELEYKEDWLNFSSKHHIDAKLMEDMLVFTDGLNPPRVISISKAISKSWKQVHDDWLNGNARLEKAYYHNESTISLAKYAPYKPIRISTLRLGEFGTPTDVAGLDKKVIATSDLEVSIGSFIVNRTEDTFLGIVESINTPTEFILDRVSPSWYSAGDILEVVATNMKNKSDDSSFQGDLEHSKDRFIRVSYRYKFEDNTYSVIAPYTQPLFIPNNNGYIDSGDEADAMKSTIIKLMENQMDSVTLYIPVPGVSKTLVRENYKIKEIDILYKESDQIAVSVLDTIILKDQEAVIELDGQGEAFITHEYESKSPYKVLPQSDTTRVSDKVPVTAEVVEVISNRVVLGNYQDRYDWPETLGHKTISGPKSPGINSSDIAAYPNHQLKQNRSYKAGIVLRDRYGRASGVIEGTSVFHDFRDIAEEVREWLGDSLKIQINTEIPKEAVGNYPGVYAQDIDLIVPNLVGVTFTDVDQNNPYQSIVFSFTGDAPNITSGEYLFRGEGDDYIIGSVLVSLGGGFGNPYISIDFLEEGSRVHPMYKNISTGSNVFIPVFNKNDKGWYSYSIVVRQQDHDYYNVYTPGILNGVPSDDHQNQAYVHDEVSFAAVSDNINKVPRDLEKVGPGQEKFRSDERLYTRVNPNGGGYNKKYKGDAFDVNVIGTHNALFESDGTDNDAGWFEKESNPNIVVMRNHIDDPIGQSLTDLENTPLLGVLETTPFNSKIELYWESSTSGLISDLNEKIRLETTGPKSIIGLTSTWNEGVNYTPSGYITDEFQIVDETLVPVSWDTVEIIKAVDNDNNTVPGWDTSFDVTEIGGSSGNYRIVRKGNKPYTKDSATIDKVRFTLKCTLGANEGSIFAGVSLENSPPTLKHLGMDLDGQLFAKANQTSGVVFEAEATNGSLISETEGLSFTATFSGDTAAQFLEYEFNNGKLIVKANGPDGSIIQGKTTMLWTLTDSSGGEGFHTLTGSNILDFQKFGQVTTVKNFSINLDQAFRLGGGNFFYDYPGENYAATEVVGVSCPTIDDAQARMEWKVQGKKQGSWRNIYFGANALQTPGLFPTVASYATNMSYVSYDDTGASLADNVNGNSTYWIRLAVHFPHNSIRDGLNNQVWATVTNPGNPMGGEFILDGKPGRAALGDGRVHSFSFQLQTTNAEARNYIEEGAVLNIITNLPSNSVSACQTGNQSGGDDGGSPTNGSTGPYTGTTTFFTEATEQ